MFNLFDHFCHPLQKHSGYKCNTMHLLITLLPLNTDQNSKLDKDIIEEHHFFLEYTCE